MPSLKRLLTSILNRSNVVQILGSDQVHPTATGWTPAYISVPGLGDYDIIHVRCALSGRIDFLTFVRGSRATNYSLTFSEAYYSGSIWTYNRMLVQVDWENNRIGLSTLNGEKSNMAMQGVWGTNKR